MSEKGDFQNEQESAKESENGMAKLSTCVGKYSPYVAMTCGAVFGANLMSPNILAR